MEEPVPVIGVGAVSFVCVFVLFYVSLLVGWGYVIFLGFDDDMGEGRGGEGADGGGGGREGEGGGSR